MTASARTALLSDDLAYRLHCLNRDNANLSLLKYTDYQGFLVTGQHSGTHWVKWMLSHAMAHHYKVAPPKYFNNPHSNDLIGHPKHKRMYPDLPRIASSHAIPPTAMQLTWLRDMRKLPPYVLVVRNMRDVLISNYEKWKHRYNVPFSEYVGGDPWNKKYITDVYNYMRFLNRWGAVLGTMKPHEIVVLRYEDIRNDQVHALRAISAQFKLPLNDDDIAAGVNAGTKEFMAKFHNPDNAGNAVRQDGKGDTAFSAQDTARFTAIIDKHLKHDFGYDYFTTPRGYQIAR